MVLVVALVLSLVAAASLVGTALAEPLTLQAFIATDFHKGLVNRALAGLPAVVFKRCPALVSNGSRVTVIKPLSFAQDGFPNAGIWKESFPVSGCGNDTILNFYFIATPEEKVNTMIGFPGSTIADPLLQKDAMTEALGAAAKPDTKDCKSFYVTNTEFLQKTGQPSEGAKGPPWDELWTLSICETKAQVVMHFIPDKTGTTIHTSLRETKFVQ